MVRTSKGPAERSKEDNTAPSPETAEDREIERNLELDDETWTRLEQVATNQQTTPSEVVRRAIDQSYGGNSWTPTSASEAFNAK